MDAHTFLHTHTAVLETWFSSQVMRASHGVKAVWKPALAQSKAVLGDLAVPARGGEGGSADQTPRALPVALFYNLPQSCPECSPPLTHRSILTTSVCPLSGPPGWAGSCVGSPIGFVPREGPRIAAHFPPWLSLKCSVVLAFTCPCQGVAGSGLCQKDSLPAFVKFPNVCKKCCLYAI